MFDQSAGVPLLCHILFYFASLELIPYVSSVTCAAIQFFLLAVSFGFTGIFFYKYKTYQSFSNDEDQSFQLWNPPPMAFYFMCIFSPLSAMVIYFHSDPFMTLQDIIKVEMTCFGICGMLILFKNKFLERELVIRKIDSAVQDQKDYYQGKYYKQVPKGDYFSKCLPRSTKDNDNISTNNVSPKERIYKKEQKSEPLYEKQDRNSVYNTVNEASEMDLDEDVDMTNVAKQYEMDAPLYDEQPPTTSITYPMLQQEEPFMPSPQPTPIQKTTITEKPRRRKSGNVFQKSKRRKSGAF